MGDFIEFSARPKEPAEENYEIITAFLSEYPFDVFEFTEGEVRAYTNDKNNHISVDEIESLIEPFIVGKVSTRIIEKENWNELWEKNFFEPVTIDDRIHIRAAFHAPMPEAELEVVIQPKMSFGTGHHSTTQLMVHLMLDFESRFDKANVLDMGSGTGVLAIVAEHLGAAEIDAVDIEDWSAENIIENAAINQCKKINGFHNDVQFLKDHPDKKYRIILANIHRQVLLNDTKEYAHSLEKEGLLFLSGFYPEDLSVIEENCSLNKLRKVKSEELGRWCAAVFVKE